MSPRAQTWLLRAWRLLALGLAALLLQRATPPRETALTRLTLADVQAFFPQARQFKPGPQETLLAQDEYGNRVGRLLTTSPDADAILGYSGPTNVLVALDNQERIVGTRILTSEDTPDHVDKLRDNAAFERGFKDWRPTSQPAPMLEGYAGSTLTALAIEESIQKRLSGNYASLRFPTPLKLEEIKSIGFPEARGFEPNTPRLGWNLVRGPGNAHLGFVVRTSPSGDEVNGYAGPTDTLIALASDGLTLRQVVIRETYDTTDYVDRVRTDAEYLKLLTKWTAREWATLDFGQARLEGVAGATLTSYAMAEGIKRRFADDTRQSGAEARRREEGARGLALWCFLLGGLVMTFSPLHGRPALRLTWQLLLVGGLGLWLGQLLSLALFAGWARHGLGWSQAPGLVALGAVALVVPWVARRQPYCHHLCPHGAAQELLGRFRGLHISVPTRWHARLAALPFLLLAVVFLAALVWPGMNLGRWEPFDAWALGAATLIPLTLAAVGLVAALFVPQGFCKYACPTGALLKLVRTPSDFGAQGEPPTHPELLDWLATEYVRTGWDTKGFIRLLMTSRAYRQDSRVTPEMLERDPENRWLARASRLRLDAEVLRDQVLALGGLLVPDIGGAPVKPYQPVNIWEPVAFGGSNTKNYVQDKGAAIYRRSLYTFWKRTAPAPSMSTFDAPARENFCVVRPRSNTPLQALALMNDVQHFEAARAFAERLLLPTQTDAGRLELAFRSATARAPDAGELSLLATALETHRGQFSRDPEAARRVITNGESKPSDRIPAPEFAAWTMVANLVLNLDETVNRN